MTSKLCLEPMMLRELSDDFSVDSEAAGTWPNGAVLPAAHRSA